MKSMLVISCSNRKSKLPGIVPALERYDGGAYRVIRKMRRDGCFPEHVDVKIISAMFGLIDATTLIPFYDLRMNRQRARELRARVQKALNKLVAEGHHSEIYVDLGTDYLPILDGFIAKGEARMSIATGKIGERLHKLKEWLASYSVDP